MKTKLVLILITLLSISCTTTREVYFSPQGELVGWSSKYEEGVDSSKSGSIPSKYLFKYEKNDFSLTFSISYTKSASTNDSPADLSRPLRFVTKVKGDHLASLDPSKWLITTPESSIPHIPVDVRKRDGNVTLYIYVTYSLIPEKVTSLTIDFGNVLTRNGIERIPPLNLKRVEGKTRTAQFTL